MKKLCLIGCGGIGSHHLDELLRLEDLVEVVGVCDFDEERAQKLAKRASSAKAYTDYLKMLDEASPDMVFICVPPYCHGDIELEVIRRGIHFFVEKPVALDIDLARQIRDAAEEKGLITSVGFQCRYSNTVAPALEFCNSKEIICVDCTRIGHVPGAFWWRDRELSGGQLVEQTIHQLDIIRYLMGEPEEVFTYNTRGFVKGVTDYDTDDCSVTVVKFKNGALGTITSGCYSKDGKCFDSKIVFSAADSRAELKITEKLTVFAEIADDKRSLKELATAIDSGICKQINETTLEYPADAENESFLCVKAFIEAVAGSDKSMIRSDYRDATRSLAFSLACNESMKTGQPVKVVTE
ncbi:MAG: Gfo/Idh/MocA family oxidoreductase [Ruminococcaceae bacterium]|nr:Gfo/Idh/MocA family oxidoreductase [Oscillospiraceae bacterium]